MKKLILIVAMTAAATLMSAPTVRWTTSQPPAATAPITQGSREAEEIVPTPPEISTAGLRRPERAIATGEGADNPSGASRQLPLHRGAEGERGGGEGFPEGEPEESAAVWREDVPLRPELQQVLVDACDDAGIDPLLMLGLIDTESGFNEDIVSQTGDYGLCQLNHLYFDPTMTPEENLRTGVELLGRHIKTYGEIGAALTAYHVGHDDGSRYYAGVVIEKAAAWGYRQ